MESYKFDHVVGGLMTRRNNVIKPGTSIPDLPLREIEILNSSRDRTLFVEGYPFKLRTR